MANNVSSGSLSSAPDTATYLPPAVGEIELPAADSASLAPAKAREQQRELAATGDASLSLSARWQRAREKWAEDAIIEAQASGFNKGGLLVSWLDLPGFVPASQLLGLRHLHLEEARLRHLRERQDAHLCLKIIEVDEEANRLIFSERATRVAAPERERLLQQIEVGEQRSGTVTNLAPFGAFVDLGGVEGLIHLSELSWRRLNHPSDVVHPGETVKVLVLNVDQERERVALSRKQLFPDPWLNVEARYRPGQVVEGKVSSVAAFGVFVLVEPELEGLLHVSEFGEERAGEPQAQFTRGNEVRTAIIHVSEQERRLGLSLRALPPELAQGPT